jgi:hypothetical protein
MENENKGRQCPPFEDAFKSLFHGNPENPTTTDYKKVRIANRNGLSLSGFLAGKSIAIPHYSPLKDESFIKDVVEANWQTFHSMGGELIVPSLFRFLNTPINTEKNGFHTMDTVIEGVQLIHIYPHAYYKTQEDFVKAFTEAYNNEGFTTSIEDPSN